MQGIASSNLSARSFDSECVPSIAAIALWIGMVPLYRQQSFWIMIDISNLAEKTASYSDCTTSAARRVRSTTVAGLVFNPCSRLSASWIFWCGSLSSYFSKAVCAIMLFPNQPSEGHSALLATTPFGQPGYHIWLAGLQARLFLP